MSYLNVKMSQAPGKYDWDDIDVGNNQLNHSENFFANKHFEHERPDEMDFLQQAFVKSELNELVEHEVFFNGESLKAKLSSTEDLKNVENLILPVVDVKNEQQCKNEKYLTSPVDLKKVPQVGLKSQLEVTDKTVNLATEINLASQWSTKKTFSGAVSKAVPPPPQAYLVKDIYRRNREEAERRRSEEERKKREFHSRPAPNYAAHHEQLKKRKPVHAVTVAVTPQVLKNSREADEKRRKRLEEWKLKNQPLKFEPRPPTVLKEKPFVPEKKPTVFQLCPFKLNMEKRLQERRQYDEMKQKSMEEKHKQMEEERKKREDEQIKELRKAATFKARPNPFKN